MRTNKWTYVVGAAMFCAAAVLTAGCGGQNETSLADAKQWDVVTFGELEQDGDESDGAEELEWYVLDRTDDRIVLLSVYVLDCLPYNAQGGATTWADCSLREYLNGSFYESVFSEEEKEQIVQYNNENKGNELLEIDGGEDTTDSVFLLNQDQEEIYFNEEEEQWLYARAEATQSAQEAGVYVSEDGYSSWWLRGSGNEEYSAKFVNTEGMIHEAGADASIDYRYGIRPALCLHI